jgi:hypothetical protein
MWVLHDSVLTLTMLKLKAEWHSFILYFHGNLLYLTNTADGKLKVLTNGTTGFFFPFPTNYATYHRQKAK